MKTILMVEDDEKLRNEMQIFLKRNGYEVICLLDYDEIMKQVQEQKQDIILLDINLPEVDGQYICKQIRTISDIPIIMVTSRNTEMDELISMNYGADDYVTKPFNTQILLAKIAAILKRTTQIPNQNKMNCDDFILNLSKSIIEKEDKTIELTKNEFKILHYLALNRGKIVSRDEIMTYLWDSEMFVDDNTLTVNMNRLRKKLEDINLTDKIETKRGQGYILK